MNCLKFKKGDTVKFTKERVQRARERGNHKWDEFVLSHATARLTITYVFEKTGNHEPFALISIDGVRGYWNQDAFEPFNNFDEDLFKL